MADKKISELTNLTGANLADADEFVVVDTSASETKAITRAELALGLGVSSTDSPTFAGLTVEGDTTTDGLDLSAIDTSIADTAVDVFVYDTSKDSDGGAWRKRTQHTSWYNETLNTSTRGSRREFPAVAVIVAETTTITIYDGDDPDLPMWMVFNSNVSTYSGLRYQGRGTNAITAVNGILYTANGTTDGVYYADFLKDHTWRIHTTTWYGPVAKTLAGRNEAIPTSEVPVQAKDGLVQPDANDIAATVLPNAPIDPATGLPVPTIAVATAGGVSVIKDDGTVVDLTYAIVSAESGDVWFKEDGGIGWSSRGSSGGFVYEFSENSIPATDKSTAPDAIYGNFGQGLADLHTVGTSSPQVRLEGATGNPQGLTLLYEKRTAPSEGMVAYTTSTYNTGWMNGDIKGAFLSDTDDTDLVGSGELVTNGEDWTGASGSTPPNSWSTTSTTIQFSVASGELTIDRNGEAAGNDMYQTVTTVVGETYVVELDVVSLTGAIRIDVTGIPAFSTSDTGVLAYTFVATSTSTYVGLRNTGTTGVAVLNYVRVKLADADRSVNNNGLIVNGTVTRTPVATGADLVAYSGFSASNYLEQPYNSALDFGTGDFCVMGWVKTSATGVDYILQRSPAGTSTGQGFFVYVDTSGYLAFATREGSSSVVIGSQSIANNVWTHFVAVRQNSGTVKKLFLNGSLHASSVVTARDVDAANSSLFVGTRADGGSTLDNGSLALLRISATAPSAEQIAKIYEDEKFLFQENAACTLYGTSDAVTALAHDEDTGLLHVGTSAGRSVFQGLRRVSNTTTAVGTAISASNGLVVEE